MASLPLPAGSITAMSSPPLHDAFAAVVLAGGRSSRLDGADKAGIEVAGRTLLATTLDAVVDANEVVVVGDPVTTERPVTFTREDPRHGGPAAALLTGVDALLRPTRLVVVTAVDMPRLTAATLARLRGAATGRDGAVLVGPDGRRQLVLALDRSRLAEVRPSYEEQHDLPVHRLLARLDLAALPAVGEEHRDVDTWADLRDLAE